MIDLHRRLSVLAAELLNEDAEIAGWIQKHVKSELDGGRRRNRKRRVTLLREDGQAARGGTFYVDADLLRDGEEVT